MHLFKLPTPTAIGISYTRVQKGEPVSLIVASGNEVILQTVGIAAQELCPGEILYRRLNNTLAPYTGKYSKRELWHLFRLKIGTW